MDDQEPLLKELRTIRQHLANIDFATGWLLTIIEVIVLFLFLAGVFRAVEALMSR
jgi:hypothetical protein